MYYVCETELHMYIVECFFLEAITMQISLLLQKFKIINLKSAGLFVMKSKCASVKGSTGLRLANIAVAMVGTEKRALPLLAGSWAL